MKLQRNKFDRVFLEFSNRLASLAEEQGSLPGTDRHMFQLEPSSKIFLNQKCQVLNESCLHPSHTFFRKNMEAKATSLLQNLTKQLQQFSNPAHQKLATQNYNSRLLALIQNSYEMVSFAQRFWGSLVTNPQVQTPDFSELSRQIDRLNRLYKKGRQKANLGKTLIRHDTKSIKQLSEMLTRPSSTHPSTAHTISCHSKKKNRPYKKHHKQFSEIKNSIFSEATKKGCKSAFNKRHTLYFQVDDANLQQFRNRNQEFVSEKKQVQGEQQAKVIQTEVIEDVGIEDVGIEDVGIKDNRERPKDLKQKRIFPKSQQQTENRKKVKFEVKMHQEPSTHIKHEQEQDHNLVLQRKYAKSKTAQHTKTQQIQEKTYTNNQRRVLRREKSLKTKLTYHSNGSQRKLKIPEEQSKKQRRKVRQVTSINQSESKKFIRDSYHDAEFNKKNHIKRIKRHRKPHEKKVKFQMGSLFEIDLNIEEEQRQEKVFKIHYQQDSYTQHQRLRPSAFSEIKIAYEDELERLNFRPYNSVIIQSQKMVNKPGYRSSTWRSFRFRPKGWNTIYNDKKKFYHELWQISKQLRAELESSPQAECQNSVFFLYEDKIKQKQNMKLQRYLNDKQSKIANKYFIMKEECSNYKKEFILQLERKFIFDSDARNIARRLKPDRSQHQLCQEDVNGRLVDQGIF